MTSLVDAFIIGAMSYFGSYAAGRAVKHPRVKKARSWLKEFVAWLCWWKQ